MLSSIRSEHPAIAAGFSSTTIINYKQRFDTEYSFRKS